MESTGSLTLDFDDWHQESCLSDLALVITSPDGKRGTRPISWNRTFIGSAIACSPADITLPDAEIESKAISLMFRDGALYLTSLGSATVEVNGAVQTFHQLDIGDQFTLAGWRFQLVKACADPIAFLESLSDPHRGTLWPVGHQPITFGRRGRRENTVELDDKSVSRTHATLLWQDGRFLLQPESATSLSRLNARQVDRPVTLRNGDTLGLGRQLLRFQTLKSSLAPCWGTVLYARLRRDDFWDSEVEQAAARMDELLRCCDQVIEAHGGTVARYLGDAPLAFFTGKKHAVQGLAAAVALEKAASQLELVMGFGVASGEMAVGLLGGEGRAQLSAVGTAVQLAVRLEQLGRETGEPILIAPSTAEAEEQEFPLQSTGLTAVFERKACLVYRLAGHQPRTAAEGQDPLRGLGVDPQLRGWLTERAFAEGEALFTQGDAADSLYLVVEGTVNLTAFSASGREFTLALRKAGELVGETALLDGEPREATATAVTTCRCLVLSNADWERNARQHPKLAHGLIRALCSHLKDSHVRIEDLGVRTVKQRLAAVLARHAEQEGEAGDEGLTLPHSVNYGMLVGLLCTNRESISRAARELMDKGLLQRHGHHFVIPDLELLREAGDE